MKWYNILLLCVSVCLLTAGTIIQVTEQQFEQMASDRDYASSKFLECTSTLADVEDNLDKLETYNLIELRDCTARLRACIGVKQ